MGLRFRNPQAALGFGGCLLILGVLLLNVFVGGLAVEYTIEFWVPRATGHAVDVPFFAAAIAGLFLGEIAIPAAILTWILAFVL